MGVGTFVAKVSTDHKTLVFGSNRARVVGLSHNGGRLATSVRALSVEVRPPHCPQVRDGEHNCHYRVLPPSEGTA